MPEILDKFFAVTLTSIYRVEAKGPYLASALKTHLSKGSSVPVGSDLGGEDEMIAVGKWLQMYKPQKFGASHQLSGNERRLEDVNRGYWGRNSSAVVALFLDLDNALRCFINEDTKPCDDRWLDETKKTLTAIGTEHPSFYIATVPYLKLLQNEGS